MQKTKTFLLTQIIKFIAVFIIFSFTNIVAAQNVKKTILILPVKSSVVEKKYIKTIEEKVALELGKRAGHSVITSSEVTEIVDFLEKGSKETMPEMAKKQ